MHRFNHPSFKPLCAPGCRRDESIGGVDRLWSRAKNGIGRRDLVGMNQGLAVKTKIMTLATFRDEAFLIVQPVITPSNTAFPCRRAAITIIWSAVVTPALPEPAGIFRSVRRSLVPGNRAAVPATAAMALASVTPLTVSIMAITGRPHAR